MNVKIEWVDKDLYRKMLMNSSIRDEIQTGRNWVCFEHHNERIDGYWLWGNWAWAPKLELMPIAVLYALTTGNNNFFYMRERRLEMGISDNDLF